MRCLIFNLLIAISKWSVTFSNPLQQKRQPEKSCLVMTWACSELGEDWRCHLVGVRLDTGTSRQCTSQPDSAAVFMKLPPREMPQSCWSWYELPHAKCGHHVGSLCSCPVFCIRRSCVLSIKTWFDFKKRALARVADTHRTISETQARLCFCLAMQMFIKNESPLFGA